MPPPVLRACTAILRTLSRLAPAWRRDDWRREWLAEVHFRGERLAAHRRLGTAAQLRLLARCCGGAFHIIWLWKHEWGIDMLSQDIRYGIRLLSRRRAFTVIAIMTLALGIGGTTAIFSAVRTVLMMPLPYPAPERLVRIDGLDTRPGRSSIGNLSVPDMVDFQTLATLFDAIGTHNSGGYWTLTGQGEPERVPRLLVTSGYFRVLQARPAAGRLFLPEEDRPTPPDIVVISSGFWHRRFAADPGAIGRTITVGGMNATIVGVLQPDFVHPERIESSPDIFALLDPDEKMSGRGGRYVRAIGKLKPAVTLGAAESELQSLAATLATQFPKSNTGRTVRIRPLHEAVAGDLRGPLLLLQAATAAVLLIACVNLANLLLGAGTGRAGELNVRAALGAGRMRLVRQLLTESLVLAMAGGLLGVAIAWWATSYLSSVAAPMLLPRQQIGVDGGVLTFAVVISVAAGVAFGLLPALSLSRDTSARRPEERRHTATPAQGRVRTALIVMEVAVSVTLLVGAILLIRSFTRLTQVDPGFQAANVLSFQLAAPATQYPEGTQSGFYARLYEKLITLPGVTAAGGVNILPLSGGYSCDGLQIEGRPAPEGQESCAEVRSASPGYFQAMGIPLIKGRLFAASDDSAAPRRVIVINEAMARQFFAGEDPIGRRIIYSSRLQNDPREIVGVVGDLHHFGLDKTPTPEFYTPQAQPPSYHGMTIVMQVHGDAQALMPQVRSEVRALAPDAPLYNVRTLQYLLDKSVSEARFRTLLLAVFAGLAVLLTVVGTYGVISIVVTERTHEMGVRLALGAARSDIVALVLGGGLKPLALGTILGLGGGLAFSQAVRGLLFQVAPADPLTFGLAALVIGAAGLLATWAPARRACRVDPVMALRAQ